MTTQTTTVVMPRLSDSMEEGTVVRWLKQEGESVETGDELVEIETDKATMVYEAEAAGVLRHLVREGETVGLGAPLAELLPASGNGDAGSAGGEVLPATAARSIPRDDGKETATPDARSAGPAAPARKSPSGNSAGGAAGTAGGRVAASPVARRLAASRGIDLGALVPGSGPHGRIVKGDVERAAGAAGVTAPPPPSQTVTPGASQPVSQPPAENGVSRIELTRLQTIVARRMSESRATVPDFSIEVDVDAGALVAMSGDLRERLPEGPRPSYNDFVIKACALALRSHPRVNGSYRDGHLELFDRVNIGFAVAAENALVVPVVNDADIKSVGAIATETRRLAERARSGALTPPEVSGGTFTVSNLGMSGVARFTAVINPPQAAILAVGAVARQPVVRDDRVEPGHVMTLTLCSDHRILYGADAAAFLADVRAALEQPIRLLV